MSSWVERDGDPFEIESANYGVRLYRRDPKRLVTVFASAGSRRVAGFSEEFRSSFWWTGTSMMFVTDRRLWWYNFPESERLLRRLAAIAGEFPHHACVGESMGACGAVLFTNYATHTDRVIGFAPQYSVFRPYIQFSPGFDYVNDEVTFPVYEDFSRSPIKSRCALIYGNTGWRDYLHASMYSAAGFRTLTIDGAPHEVAAHLKTAYAENSLKSLAGLLADPGREFTTESLRRYVAAAWTDQVLRPEHRFAVEFSARFAFNRRMSDPQPIPPASLPLLSERRPAVQSSVCQWSTHQDRALDASGAVDGHIEARHHFHTDFEERPWWMVDLQGERLVLEIRVFNRIDDFFAAARAFDFRLELSSDGTSWEIVADRHGELPFGGADGRPFILTLAVSSRCRYVRFSLNRAGHLHLNQLQVFGFKG